MNWMILGQTRSATLESACPQHLSYRQSCEHAFVLVLGAAVVCAFLMQVSKLQKFCNDRDTGDLCSQLMLHLGTFMRIRL